MDINQNYSLKNHNTFHVNVFARYYKRITTFEELIELPDSNYYSKFPKLFLGEGSNILFTKDFEGLVIGNSIKGIEILEEDDDFVLIRVQSGEKWHDFVQFCVERNYCGLENLSLIPGTVGAAPIQNIGAYGVEQKDIFHSLEALDLHSKKIRIFEFTECKFGYRDSIFKNKFKNKFFISSVTYKLTKKLMFNTEYEDIKRYIEKACIENLTPQIISNIIIDIRRSKLPDPQQYGNAGSFFKNPEISEKKYNKLIYNFTEIRGNKTKEGTIKISAAWLIDKCGWKGKRINSVGIYQKHALILVNYGDASGVEIYNLSKRIRNSVNEQFEIELEAEVNII